MHPVGFYMSPQAMACSCRRPADMATAACVMRGDACCGCPVHPAFLPALHASTLVADEPFVPVFVCCTHVCVVPG